MKILWRNTCLTRSGSGGCRVVLSVHERHTHDRVAKAVTVIAAASREVMLI